tara:strand:+ start:128 stop:343 length:216 start_codon:yes stop_codon:yes gene_type:complete
MNSNICLFCGSSNLRADRALSGRLVCTSCGNPYGVRKGRRNTARDLNKFNINIKYWLFLCVLIFTFILVVI